MESGLETRDFPQYNLFVNKIENLKGLLRMCRTVSVMWYCSARLLQYKKIYVSVSELLIEVLADLKIIILFVIICLLF